MTKAEFKNMTLDEVIEYANENINDLTTEEVLLMFAKDKIDDDNINMAYHILKSIYESGVAYNDYYLYDYSMGMCETPTPVTCKEDFEDYIDFEDED